MPAKLAKLAEGKAYHANISVQMIVFLWVA
jgi:hypothetical protein